MDRASGILMHISSLPNDYGIGTFGKEAYEFVDFLKKCGQKYWQILPLGQTSYGDSPYQSFSAFAGNPYFVNFDMLYEEGLLKKDDYENRNYGDNHDKVDYSLIFKEKMGVLRKAYKNLKPSDLKKIEDFKEEQKLWIEDYALYMAVKEKFNLKSWQQWDDDIKRRKIEALELYKKELKDETEFWCFLQYHFFKQWKKLKDYANKNGVEIIGDIPIYVAEDSADCWSNPDNFLIDKKTLKTLRVAGCPPDDFTEDGQLWGNPIYDWDNLEKDNYKWWIDRVRESFKLYDVLRIDHFRGFESFWSISKGDKTAKNGKWVKGPGMKLFNAIKKELGEVNVIAEDLGFMTKEVIKLREDTGFPGMKVLQFAFSGPDNSDLPHDYESRNCIAYTGTHDNETMRGWFENPDNKKAAKFAKKYCNLSRREGYNWGFIRTIWSSIADVSIAPMQDFLNLNNNARMNIPSTLGCNWQWRMKKGALTDKLADKIYYITKMYGRCN